MKRHVYLYLLVTTAALSTALVLQPTHTKQRTQKDALCVICSEPITDPVTLECGHRFNRRCMNKRVSKKTTCPTCNRVTKYQPR